MHEVNAVVVEACMLLALRGATSLQWWQQPSDEERDNPARRAEQALRDVIAALHGSPAP